MHARRREEVVGLQACPEEEALWVSGVELGLIHSIICTMDYILMMYPCICLYIYIYIYCCICTYTYNKYMYIIYSMVILCIV